MSSFYQLVIVLYISIPYGCYSFIKILQIIFSMICALKIMSEDGEDLFLRLWPGWEDWRRGQQRRALFSSLMDNNETQFLRTNSNNSKEKYITPNSPKENILWKHRETEWEANYSWKLITFLYFIQHCFICRQSDSTISEDAGIEPRIVATLALSDRRSKHSASKDLIH